MRNVTVSISSFVAGVALTAAFFTLDDDRSMSGEATFDSAGRDIPSDGIRAASLAEAAVEVGQGRSSGELDFEVRSINEPTINPLSASAATEADPGRDRYAYEDSVTGSSVDAGLPESIRDPVGPPGSAQREPVPIPEELQQIFDSDPKATDFHDQLEKERREESWAAYMEGQFAAYLGSKPELAAFQILMIQCRASKCEIKALGYGPDAAPTWFAAVADLPDQPWAVEFDDGTFQMSEPEPGVTAILMQFGRLKGQSTLNAIDSMVTREE